MTGQEQLALPQAAPVPLVSAAGERLGFGDAFTPSMAVAGWRADAGWEPLELGPRRPLLIDPAMVSLHYGQVVFEGLKAYRTGPQSVAVFRPDAYAGRMRASARRFSLPEPPVELFCEAVEQVARADAAWLPDEPSAGLYLRPLLMATEPSLALRPAGSCVLIVMAFATGGFFSDLPDPIRVWVERDSVRAAPGGTGFAKCSGNYAPTYTVQMRAAERGCDQAVWLDAGTRSRVEELGGMNLFVVRSGESGPVLCTPPLTDTILPGVTRDTLLQLARALGMQTREEELTVAEWRAGAASGEITETFACGTGAGVTPVGSVLDGDESWSIGDGGPGKVTLQLRQALWDAQHGTGFEQFGWLRP